MADLIPQVMRALLGRRPIGEEPAAELRPLWFVPGVEIRERGDAYVLEADLPGVREDDLDIVIAGRRLTLSGRREPDERDEGRYFTRERPFGAFTRSFTLPEAIDAEHVDARLENGVLRLVLPKAAHARKVEVGAETPKAIQASAPQQQQPQGVLEKAKEKIKETVKKVTD